MGHRSLPEQPQPVIQLIHARYVTEKLVPLFEKSGVRMSENARNLLAYVLQSQVEEGLSESDNAVHVRCDGISDFAVKLYVKKFGEREMNSNRAVHLITALTCA